MKLSDIGEFGLIDRISRGSCVAADVRLGIGDDCAAVTIPPDELLLTSTDLLLEEIHFRLDWTDWFSLGRKCVSVNVSDIAAMGGTPRHILLGLGLAQEHQLSAIEQLIAGVRSAAADYAISLVGGDTCRSPGPLFLAVTIQGSVPAAEMLTRSGARAGDDLYVTGTLGDSALALSLLQRGIAPHPALAGRHHDPTARSSVGRELARRQLASAMLDISDGLLGDLEHLLAASTLGVTLEGPRVPLSAPFRAALATDAGLFSLALSGGEDYELLFSAPPQQSAAIAELAAATQLPITRIGTLCPDPAARRITGHDGTPIEPPAGGYNHFRRKVR